MVIEQTMTTYKTSDGRIFTKRAEAEEHEKALSGIKAFTVYAFPDLNEGRHGPTCQGFVLVNASADHALFAQHWAFKRYGSAVAFVQGVFGSNAIAQNWRLTAADSHEDARVIARIEERFPPKVLWGEGMHERSANGEWSVRR